MESGDKHKLSTTRASIIKLTAVGILDSGSPDQESGSGSTGILNRLIVIYPGFYLWKPIVLSYPQQYFGWNTEDPASPVV